MSKTLQNILTALRRMEPLSEKKIESCYHLGFMLQNAENYDAARRNYFPDEKSRQVFDWRLQNDLLRSFYGEEAPEILDNIPYPKAVWDSLTQQAERMPPVVMGDYTLDRIHTWILEGYSLKGRCEVEPGDIVLDCGTYTGNTSVYFSQKAGESGHVYGFEPGPAIFWLYNKNMESYSNVSPVNAALVDKVLLASSATMGFKQNMGAGCRLAADGDVQVPVTAIDVFCLERNVPRVDFIKMDIEGATLPNGMTIKKAKLRGAPSHGMICSEVELGLSEDHSGIMVLDAGLQPGVKLTDALKLETEVLDIGITPNRGDCLSVLGLAREAALAFDLPLSLTPPAFSESGKKASEAISISVQDAEDCPLYMARVLENVTIGKSPDWLRFRLLAMGMRPISNIVDITNYVMLGFGQPLHAFDFAKIRGGKIVVKRASDGDVFTTLDGQERKLTSRDLTICDGVGPVALAGVMGGLESEITDTSRSVLLECATFRPQTVRHTARRLGIPSESSYRYERGVDQALAPFCLDMAAALMASSIGGPSVTLYAGVSKDEPRPWKGETARFRPARCNKLLGQPMDEAFCMKTLEKLGCKVDAANREDWAVLPPSHRPDLTREADFIEEVARVYGVDRFEPTLPAISQSLDRAGTPESEFAFWQRIRRWGSGLGMNEVINYSFTGSADLDKLGLPQENRIRIMNPLSSEMDVMRTALVPGLLASLRNNLAQGHTGLRLFEVAHVFHADKTSDTTAREPGRIGMLFYGDRNDSSWPHAPAIAEYADLKGVVEHLLAFLHIEGARFEAAESHPWLRPAVTVSAHGKTLGHMGRVLPEIADASHARHDVWVAELDLDVLRELHDAVKVTFAPLPVYPPVRRDITLAVPYSLPAESVLDAITAMRTPLLEEAHLHDVYAPENEETRRLTYRMTFRHAKRPLEDAEVDKQRDKIAAHLTATLPVTL
ncbi:phenylalanine--tRNA ligase subunit beta [Desulfovibrio sp. OttesenSCG-928-O18]|nr:phenylalanine--tRNA ligase subunit beta [Desulfovibrio sp. OttesenSCG-928-O18]